MIALPPSWRWVTLNDLQADEPRAITDGPFGSNLTSAHYVESGPRVVRLQNIGDGEFIDAEARISSEHFESLRAHEVLPGDLLIASLGESPPRACLAPSWLGPAIVKADCIRVRLSPSVEPRWVLYALQAPATRHWAGDRTYGVGRPRLGLKTIRSIPVPLPPLQEQRRIVEILEDHLSRLDAASSAAERADARLGILDQAWVCTHPILSSAPRMSLVELLAAPLSNGRSVPDGSGFPVLRLTCLRNGRVDLAERKRGRWPAADAARFLVVPGDFLVARGNGSLQLVGLGALVDQEVPEPVAYPDTLIRVRPRVDLLEPRLLAILWNSRVVRRQIEGRARTTAGIYKVNQRQLESVELPVPSLSVQQKLLVDAEQQRDASQRLRLATGRLIINSVRLRRALLEAAFTGRLTGRASDEEVVQELAGV